MIRTHLAAVVALLATRPASLHLWVPTLDDAGQVPSANTPPDTPYVVVRPDGMPLSSDRLAQWSTVLNGRIYVTHVGATQDEVLWAMEQTRALLLDAYPVVSGRSVSPLAIVASGPIEADRDVSPPVLVGVDIYRLFST